jgi:DNA-directed RNA polymerase
MVSEGYRNTRELQELREITQLDDGVARYYRQVEKQGAGEVAAGLGLVYTAMHVMIPEIKEQVRILESGETHASKVQQAVHYMCGMNPDAMAYITAKVCVTAAAQMSKVTRTAMKIANLIEEDYRFEQLEQAQPALANSMSRKAAKWSTSGARRRIMRKAAQIAGIQGMGWTEGEKLRLGMALLEMFIKLTGFATLEMEADSGRTTKLFTLTPAAKERLDDRHVQLQGERPVNTPMIHPPKKWTSPTNGGYLTERMKTNLVRSIGMETRDDLMSADLTEVYEAVNAIQATRWSINNDVLRVLRQVYAEGGTLGDLPERDDLPLPERPDSIDRKLSPEKMPEKMKATFTEWKQRARETYEYNAKLASKRHALRVKLDIAEELKLEEAIYFPHSLDFRGRIYSMSAELSPQSDDVAKSLIQFADGKPLGEFGGYWLAVHIANLFGIDKVSFDERVRWVQDFQKEILDSADNPLDGFRFWTTADDPWCALAACFEWSRFVSFGAEAMSYLPIAMDGSCSGIQHFSAMLRDAEGGKAVNLTPSETPTDIYTEVLNVVKAKLMADSEPLAKVWMDKVDRKIVKRPCMTFAYSVTSIGIREQISGEMRKQSDGQYIPGWENWQAAAFLAPVVEASIREVVKRAAEAMDWLKEISKAYSKEQIPTSWVTPLGFPVVQPYRKAKGKQFWVWFQGSKIRLTLRVESRDVDSRKQASSVAPNYVHSLDATHLMMVVNMMKNEGITDSFAMIHDSFGVHAADVDELHYAIRDQFIELYSDDVLTQVYQQCLPALPGKRWKDVPVPPEKGTLDLQEVRDADFFFA